MAHYYRTKTGDTLDEICWQYYVKEINLGAAAMSVDPRLLTDNTTLENGFFLNSESDQRTQGSIEMVLQANPGLASYPLTLPMGLNILLPDLETSQVENDSVKLWD